MSMSGGRNTSLGPRLSAMQREQMYFEYPGRKTAGAGAGSAALHSHVHLAF